MAELFEQHPRAADLDPDPHLRQQVEVFEPHDRLAVEKDGDMGVLYQVAAGLRLLDQQRPRSVSLRLRQGDRGQGLLPSPVAGGKGDRAGFPADLDASVLVLVCVEPEAQPAVPLLQRAEAQLDAVAVAGVHAATPECGALIRRGCQDGPALPCRGGCNGGCVGPGVAGASEIGLVQELIGAHQDHTNFSSSSCDQPQNAASTMRGVSPRTSGTSCTNSEQKT